MKKLTKYIIALMIVGNFSFSMDIVTVGLTMFGVSWDNSRTSHAIAGGYIARAAEDKGESPLGSFGTVALFGIAKECFDVVTGSFFDWGDVGATMTGWGLEQGYKLIFEGEKK